MSLIVTTSQLKICPYEEVGCKFKHEQSEICKFNKQCNFKLCQFKHSHKKDAQEGQIGNIGENDEVDNAEIVSENEEIESDNEYDLDESENDDDDYLTDNDTTDYDKVDLLDLKKNQDNDCGACSKILTVENSYKCKTCGEASHRTKQCNTCFDHVKKHLFCGGRGYAFRAKELGNCLVSLQRPMCTF